MKNISSIRSETSTHSFAAFETQTKTTKSKTDSNNSSKTSGLREAPSRMDEINAKDWYLSEKLARDYNRTFNNQKPRSQNFKLHLEGTYKLVDPEANEKKLQAKFQKYKELRVRDFQSNINTLPNPENVPTKECVEKEFLLSPKQKSALSTKIYESFYFKPSTIESKENELPKQYQTYKKDAKQFEFPNKRKDLSRHYFMFYSNNIF
jgi:hypothetical protein